MSRIAILEGFGGYYGDPARRRRKTKRVYRRGGATAQRKKFSHCAKIVCKGGPGYRKCMKVCLRGAARRRRMR